tara:strand:- start:478 stop:615 length:138 start_codon:yes stop_codon:yes gene_type:complete
MTDTMTRIFEANRKREKEIAARRETIQAAIKRNHRANRFRFNPWT